MTDYRHSHTKLGTGQKYAESFSQWSYRNYIWEWEKSVLNEILAKYIHASNFIHHLDFACGTGRVLAHLGGHVAESTGVDISGDMLSAARHNVNGANLIEADLTTHNILVGQEFNIITAFRFFLNAQPELRTGAFAILSDLLSEDGYLVFNVHMNRSSLTARFLRGYGKLRGLRQPTFNQLSIDEISSMLQESNLEIVDMYQHGVFPIVNEDTRIPISIISSVDAVASRIKFLSNLSRYQIFVCKKAV